MWHRSRPVFRRVAGTLKHVTVTTVYYFTLPRGFGASPREQGPREQRVHLNGRHAPQIGAPAAGRGAGGRGEKRLMSDYVEPAQPGYFTDKVLNYYEDLFYNS